MSSLKALLKSSDASPLTLDPCAHRANSPVCSCIVRLDREYELHQQPRYPQGARVPATECIPFCSSAFMTLCFVMHASAICLFHRSFLKVIPKQKLNAFSPSVSSACFIIFRHGELSVLGVCCGSSSIYERTPLQKDATKANTVRVAVPPTASP